MKNRIYVGIIGVGGVGERLLQAFNRHDKAKVVGVFDSSEERVKEVAKKYGVMGYETYLDLIKDEKINLVYLAVPPKYHHNIATEIIRNKKHILCEKPLANSIEEAREMLELAEEYDIVHGMNFPTIYRSAFLELEKRVKEDFLGTLRRIELKAYFQQWPRAWQQNPWISSREQGGFVREVFSHYIQMIHMLFGEIHNLVSNIEYPQDITKCETGIIATGYLENGVPLLLNSFSDIGQKENISFTLYGTEGTISLVNWGELWFTSKNQEVTKETLVETDHLVQLIDEVFKAINKEEAKVITFKEGYEVQKAIETLLKRT